MARRSTGLLLSALFLFVAGCPGEPPARLRSTLRTGGPRVVYDLEAEPLPEIPFPNTAATRRDDSSPTGRRLNISELADTKIDRRLREKMNELDGFGVYSPMWVRFDAPIDIRDLWSRQNDNHDIADDGILLVRLGPGEACASDPEGERFVPLDVGGGSFPLVLERPCQYEYHPWEGDYKCILPSCEGDDPRPNKTTLLFDTAEEDLNGNGVLDPYEDTDYDGHLDHPNTWSGEAHARGEDPAVAADDLVTFYEKETNTLIVWPLVTLHEASTYAVVLTKNIKGEGGEPVESPFPGISAADQVDDLRQLGELLPCWGLTLDDVAFAWTFTTGTPSRDLMTIREGLYGSGPLAALAAENPPESMIPRLARDPEKDGTMPDEPYVLPMEKLAPLVTPLAGSLLETTGAGNRLVEDMKAIDYWVVGEFDSPWFLVDQDGYASPGYPDDADETFDLDASTGTGRWETRKVPFICAIPKATADNGPPFPVAIYGHGYSGASFEIMGFSGRFAKAGMALCGIEAPGHGVIIPADEPEISATIDFFLDLGGLRNFADSYLGGRVRDLDNDGVLGGLDNGCDFWTADIFHTRDMVRQLIIDHSQFIRVLRAVDGVRRTELDTNGDGTPDLVGDFNGDGVPDIGGWRDLDGDGERDADEPDQSYYMWGQSLGGIASAAMAGAEPALRAAAPSSGAAGLTQVATRSTNVGVPEATLLPMFGPFITFAPQRDEEGEPTGAVEVGFLVPNVNSVGRYVFHVSDEIRPRDRVIVRNLATGHEVKAWATDDLTFRVPIQADAMNAGEKRVFLHMDPSLKDDEGNPLGPVTVTPEQTLQLGDPLEIIVLDGWDGEERERIDTVTVPFSFYGAHYPEGVPLVALQEGMGYFMGSPDFRRLILLAQTAVEPADPAVYASRIWRRPFDFSYETGDVAERIAEGERPSLVVYHSVGDDQVPIETGVALARVAGIIDIDTPLDAYDGQTENEVLISHHVVEGVERLLRYPQRKEEAKLCPPRPASEWRCPPARIGEEDRYRAFFDEEGGCVADHGDCPEACPEGEACFYDGFCTPCKDSCRAMADADIEGVHFDVMDFDDATDRLILPEYNLRPPLRPTVENEHGVYALRIAYMDRQGSHGVPPSIPERAFDINGYVVNQIVTLFLSNGRELIDDPCLAEDDCSFFPWD